MALNATLKLKGAKQGEIRGSVTQKGRENTILVLGVDHTMLATLDARSGMFSGTNRHQPLVILKELDQATPLLHNALTDGETLSEFTLRFYRPSATGAEENFYTVTLLDARIVSIRFEMLNNKYPDLAGLKERERIAFVYQKIRVSWTTGAIESDDDWAAPIA
ncbi:MAG: type VI secretion system tube protein Hcp [Deltaproteobacteria bacterium]|nr:type VI secretion system tube protein Hcp [Deltaproteobacteria bacterium]